MAKIREATVYSQVASPSLPTGSLRQKGTSPPRLELCFDNMMIVVICDAPKVGQMFNALGLGFSFVLSFLILPEEGDDESEGIRESKNGTDCSNSSLTLEDLTPVVCSPSLSFIPSFIPLLYLFPLLTSLFLFLPITF